MMNLVPTILSAFLALCLTGAFWSPVLAQGYPAKPVRLIVPAAPGSSTDILGRQIGQKLSERWQQSVIIDNRAGAGGMPGVAVAARSSPDGYTLVIVNTGFAITAGLFKDLSFDPIKDLVPVRQVASQPMIMVVPALLGVRSVKELLVAAKGKPDQINFGSNGNGSISHLVAELFKTKTGVRMLHVPYKSSGPATTALLAGEIQVLFPALPGILPHMKTGKVRALAVSTAHRSSAVPEVPTMIEAGVPDFDEANWQGLLAPAGTAQAIILKLNADVGSILEAPDVKANLDAQGAEASVSDPVRFGKLIRTEIAKWKKLISESGARVD